MESGFSSKVASFSELFAVPLTCSKRQAIPESGHRLQDPELLRRAEEASEAVYQARWQTLVSCSVVAARTLGPAQIDTYSCQDNADLKL